MHMQLLEARTVGGKKKRHDGGESKPVATKELANCKQTHTTARLTCMKVGVDHQLTVQACTEELNETAKANQIVDETTAGEVD